MTAVIEARGLRKFYGSNRALNDVTFSVAPGRIVGMIGANGAGKTTALKAILGLTSFEGDLTVLGRNPRTQRDDLMRDVCFIADVAVLSRWLKVSQALDYVAGVHPRFNCCPFWLRWLKFRQVGSVQSSLALKFRISLLKH